MRSVRAEMLQPVWKRINGRNVCVVKFILLTAEPRILEIHLTDGKSDVGFSAEQLNRILRALNLKSENEPNVWPVRCALNRLDTGAIELPWLSERVSTVIAETSRAGMVKLNLHVPRTNLIELKRMGPW